MWTNHEGEIFIEEGEIFIGVYIIYFMLLMTHKKNHKKNLKKKNTKITKKRNIPIIIWMVTLIKHSTTNKTNSNNN